jgi:hypothetical protein
MKYILSLLLLSFYQIHPAKADYKDVKVLEIEGGPKRYSYQYYFSEKTIFKLSLTSSSEYEAIKDLEYKCEALTYEYQNNKKNIRQDMNLKNSKDFLRSEKTKKNKYNVEMLCSLFYQFENN